MLEIGTGTGWFPLLCKKKDCLRRLEISPQLIETARQLGQNYGIEVNIQQSYIEDTSIGKMKYDIIIAQPVFEHVKRWERGLQNVYDTLKSNGLLLFNASNKYSLRSPEFNFPLYGWLPDICRYRVRQLGEGRNVMDWGIDYNQFTHIQLRHFFKNLGFSAVYDWIDSLEPDKIPPEAPVTVFSVKARPLAEIIKKTSSKSGLIRELILCFFSNTNFICIK
jgi:SAM-dependent methyltransferase